MEFKLICHVHKHKVYTKKGRFSQISSNLLTCNLKKKVRRNRFSHLKWYNSHCAHTLLYFDIDVKQNISYCALQIVSNTATPYVQEVVVGLDKPLLRRPSLVLQVPLADI